MEANVVYRPRVAFLVQHLNTRLNIVQAPGVVKAEQKKNRGKEKVSDVDSCQADSQSLRQPYNQVDSQIDRHTDRTRDREIYTHRESHTDTHRERSTNGSGKTVDRQTSSQPDRQRETASQPERQRERQPHRETARESENQRDRYIGCLRAR